MEPVENQAQPELMDEAAEANKSLTLSKTETIALLNDSIDRLEKTIEKISQNSTTIPSANSVNDLLSIAQALEKSIVLQSQAADPTKIATGEGKSVPASNSTASSRTPTENIATASNRAVPGPTTKSKPKQDTPTTVIRAQKNTGLIVIVVTAIAVAIVTLFWLWQPDLLKNLSGAGNSAATETVSQTSLKEPISPNDAVDNSREIPDALTADNSELSFPDRIEPITEPVKDVVETVIPNELVAPGRAKELKITAIEPQLEFTPEQNLVAALEHKVVDLTQTYPEEYVASIEIDIPNDSLVVRVTDNWYDLEESRQNSLGERILQRSREFGFRQLKLKDSKGTLVARQPIIGNNIILVR